MSSLKQRTASGLLWGGFSNGVVQLLGALFGFWLLKILEPSDYGKMAALVIFSNLASCLQESGFTAALANKHEPSHEDYNAVFWFNILVGLTLYVILFFVAPLIADFYHEPVLVPLSRFVFLGFVVSALGTAQRAYLFGHLMVRQTSIALMTAITLSGIVGVALAYAGLAFWGLAAQSLVYVSIVTAVSWHFSPWRPTLPVSLRATLRPAWRMFGFSSKLLANSIAFQFNNNAFGVLLKRFYLDGGYVAGIYSNARKWNDMAIATIGGMVQSVAQPVLREAASNANETRTVFRKLLRFTCFISFPCLLGLALIARDFVVVLLGGKWAESVPLLQMLCIYGAFSPIVTLYSNLVISRGRSTINMIIGIANCILVWAGIIAIHHLQSFNPSIFQSFNPSIFQSFNPSIFQSPTPLTIMVAYYVVLNISWLFVWQACARSLIDLRWRHALKDILPFWLFAVTVTAAAWWFTTSMPLSIGRMFLRMAIAVTLYIGLLWLVRAKILRESIDFIFKH